MNKLVIVKSDGSLPIRGGINGPITSPTSLNVKEIVALLNKFKEVYEVNPYTENRLGLLELIVQKKTSRKLLYLRQYLFLRKRRTSSEEK